MGGRSDKWRNEKGSGSRESRARVAQEEEAKAGQMHLLHGRRSFRVYSSRSEEWTPESFSLVIQDGAQLQKPSSPVVDDHRAFSYPQERIPSLYGGTNLFLYLRSWPIIFLRTLLPTMPSEKERCAPSRATVAFLSLRSLLSLMISVSVKVRSGWMGQIEEELSWVRSRATRTRELCCDFENGKIVLRGWRMFRGWFISLWISRGF